MAGSSTRGGGRSGRGRGRNGRGSKGRGTTKQKKVKENSTARTCVKDKGKDSVVHVQSTCTKESDGNLSQDKGKAHVVPEEEYLYSGPSTDGLCNVYIWHGGKFVKVPRPEYVNGKCEKRGPWDVDEVNSIEVGKIVSNLGYVQGEFRVWYKQPNLSLEHGCRPFNNDKDVLQFLSDVEGQNFHIFYVEHLVEVQPVGGSDVIKEGPRGSVVRVAVDVIKEGPVTGEGNKEVVSCKDTSTEGEGSCEEVIVEGVGAGEVIKEGEGVADGSKEGERSEEVIKEGVGAGEVIKEGEGVVDGSKEGEKSGEVIKEGVGSAEVTKEIVVATDLCETLQDGIEVNVEEDEGGKDDSDNSLDDSDYDETWDWNTAIVSDEDEDAHLSEEEEVIEDLPPTNFEDFDKENDSSDYLDTPPGSDAEEDVSELKKFPRFKLGKDGKEVKFSVGQIFSSSKLFRTAIREYSVYQRKNVIFEKSESTRVVVKCEGECTFYCRLGKHSGHNFWQITGLVDEHTCCRTAKNRHAKPKWVARKLLPIIRHNPNISLKAITAECQQRWGIVPDRYKDARIRREAKKLMDGAEEEQYNHLRSYADELLRTNPNSTVIVKSDVGDNGPVFMRIYVCFGACKTAFARTCRPLIGLDGCFLKGMYGGQLLSAVGKDGNNQMFPIAFAVVEAETKETWDWFVELLVSDLNSVEKKQWSFISDQQKGLESTLNSLYEDVDHRVCVKHVYGNWRKKFPGEEMKSALWSAARANTVPQFERAMNAMKELNEEAYMDMMRIPAKQWSRSHFSTHTQCDLQVNNMCEAFNRAILEHREKPIISLIEGIKCYISARIVKQRQLMSRYMGGICPMIQQKLEQYKKKADGWLPQWMADREYSKFQVSNGISQYAVELKDRHCACRRCDLSGIPCAHAIACIWYNNRSAEHYVSDCYRRENFLTTYSYIICPSNGPKLWPINPLPPLSPPYVRRAPGRPKTKRNKKNDEPKNPYKLGRTNLSQSKCSRCGKSGHNIKTCGGKTGADRDIPKGGNKTNKKKVHPTSKASGSGTKPGTKSYAATQMPPRYKPAYKRKRKPKQNDTTVQPSQPNASQSSVQGSTITSQLNASQPSGSQPNASQPSGPNTRGRKRAREGLGTQESTM